MFLKKEMKNKNINPYLTIILTFLVHLLKLLLPLKVIDALDLPFLLILILNVAFPLLLVLALNDLPLIFKVTNILGLWQQLIYSDSYNLCFLFSN